MQGMVAPTSRSSGSRNAARKSFGKVVRSKIRFTCNLYPPERSDGNSNYVLGGLGAAFLLHSN